MSSHFTRRRFLRVASTAASMGVLGNSLFPTLASAAPPVLVRRDVGALAASDPILDSYRKAIKAMKALPNSDPRSWAYQAAIHGTLATPVQVAWNTCEHGTKYFWSWHRMYLYWFERIIRKMSGDYGWALPYWNWSSPSERQLPSPFRDTSSELYVANRSAAMNNGTGSLPASHVDYSLGFAFTSFISASSSIEGTPHGAVHVDVGGWMGSVPTAGQDPIFYLHHCNIDRLWNLWLAQGGGRSDPLADSEWRNTKLTFFDENGAQVQMTGCAVLRAAQQLNYSYEGEPAQVNQYCLRVFPTFFFQKKILLRLPPPPVLSGERVSFPIEIKQIGPRAAAIAESKTETLLLELDEVVADRPPGVVWEVYVGLPANAPPDPKSPYFVGTVALFGSGIRSETHQKFKPAHFTFRINRAILAALRGRQARVAVTFIPTGVLVEGRPSPPKVEAPVHVGRVTVSVETAQRR